MVCNRNYAHGPYLYTYTYKPFYITYWVVDVVLYEEVVLLVALKCNYYKYVNIQIIWKYMRISVYRIW